MARKYAKLWLSAWAATSDFPVLTADAQWLYWTLIGHPKLSPAGVLPLQTRQWAKRARGMTTKRVTAAYDELVDARYLLADDDTEEVLIRTFIRHDKGYRTPNIRKSIATSIERIESHRLRVTATHELTLALTLEGTLSGTDDEGVGEPLPEGLPEPITEPMGHRTPVPKNGRPQDFQNSSSQSSSTSTVGTRRGRSEDDQRSGRDEDGSITALIKRAPILKGTG